MENVQILVYFSHEMMSLQPNELKHISSISMLQEDTNDTGIIVMTTHKQIYVKLSWLEFFYNETVAANTSKGDCQLERKVAVM